MSPPPDEVDTLVGTQFAVTLADQPGSGHAWVCRRLPDGIELRDERYLGTPGGAVGSARSKEFLLVAERAGDFTIVFDLKRRWKDNVAETRVVRVRAHWPDATGQQRSPGWTSMPRSPRTPSCTSPAG